MGLARAAAAIALTAALAAGAGACSDDDDGGFAAEMAEDAGETDRVPAEGACRLLSPEDLEAVTGQPFQPGRPADRTCTYQGEDGRATVTVNVTELPEDAALALETASATCDEGSVAEVAVAGATGSFACTVSGVTVAAGTSTGTYAVVMGAALGDPAAPASAFPLLGELLSTVLAGGDEASES